MRNILLLCLLIFLFSCEENETDDLLPTVPVNVIVDLNLPQYINLQTPTGWVYTTGGYRGVFIQYTGIGNPPYKSFERACPNNDCSAPMTFDGSLKFTCPCDNSEYSIIDGQPLTEGNSYIAREYRVQVKGSTLKITNY